MERVNIQACTVKRHTRHQRESILLAESLAGKSILLADKLELLLCKWEDVVFKRAEVYDILRFYVMDIMKQA